MARFSRAYGRMKAGLQRSLFLGCRLRRTKYSPLLKNRKCLMCICLTSVDNSSISISKAWKILLLRIRRKYPNFEYLKLRTDEGKKGVLHIIARNEEFISKEWFSENWSDIFGAFVTWSTQLWGNLHSLMHYLCGYLEHHSFWRLGYSKNWVFEGWLRYYKEYFRMYKKNPEYCIRSWNRCLKKMPVNERKCYKQIMLDTILPVVG